MDSFINKLRNKSDEEKKQWVKILAIVTTVLVILIWVLLRYVLFVPVEREQVSESNITPTINDVYQESSEQFNSLRNDFEETPEFFPDYSVPEDESMELTEPSSELEVENKIEFETQTETQPMPEPEESPETQPTEFFNS